MTIIDIASRTRYHHDGQQKQEHPLQQRQHHHQQPQQHQQQHQDHHYPIVSFQKNSTSDILPDNNNNNNNNNNNYTHHHPIITKSTNTTTTTNTTVSSASSLTSSFSSSFASTSVEPVVTTNNSIFVRSSSCETSSGKNISLPPVGVVPSYVPDKTTKNNNNNNNNKEQEEISVPVKETTLSKVQLLQQPPHLMTSTTTTNSQPQSRMSSSSSRSSRCRHRSSTNSNNDLQSCPNLLSSCDHKNAQRCTTPPPPPKSKSTTLSPTNNNKSPYLKKSSLTATTKKTSLQQQQKQQQKQQQQQQQQQKRLQGNVPTTTTSTSTTNGSGLVVAQRDDAYQNMSQPSCKSDGKNSSSSSSSSSRDNNSVDRGTSTIVNQTQQPQQTTTSTNVHCKTKSPPPPAQLRSQQKSSGMVVSSSIINPSTFRSSSKTAVSSSFSSTISQQDVMMGPGKRIKTMRMTTDHREPVVAASQTRSLPPPLQPTTTTTTETTTTIVQHHVPRKDGTKQQYRTRITVGSHDSMDDNNSKKKTTTTTTKIPSIPNLCSNVSSSSSISLNSCNTNNNTLSRNNSNSNSNNKTSASNHTVRRNNSNQSCTSRHSNISSSSRSTGTSDNIQLITSLSTNKSLHEIVGSMNVWDKTTTALTNHHNVVTTIHSKHSGGTSTSNIENSNSKTSHNSTREEVTEEVVVVNNQSSSSSTHQNQQQQKLNDDGHQRQQGQQMETNTNSATTAISPSNASQCGYEIELVNDHNNDGNNNKTKNNNNTDHDESDARKSTSKDTTCVAIHTQRNDPHDYYDPLMLMRSIPTPNVVSDSVWNNKNDDMDDLIKLNRTPESTRLQHLSPRWFTGKARDLLFHHNQQDESSFEDDDDNNNINNNNNNADDSHDHHHPYQSKNMELVLSWNISHNGSVVDGSSGCNDSSSTDNDGSSSSSSVSINTNMNALKSNQGDEDDCNDANNTNNNISFDSKKANVGNEEEEVLLATDSIQLEFLGMEYDDIPDPYIMSPTTATTDMDPSQVPPISNLQSAVETPSILPYHVGTRKVQDHYYESKRSEDEELNENKDDKYTTMKKSDGSNHNLQQSTSTTHIQVKYQVDEDEDDRNDDPTRNEEERDNTTEDLLRISDIAEQESIIDNVTETQKDSEPSISSCPADNDADQIFETECVDQVMIQENTKEQKEMEANVNNGPKDVLIMSVPDDTRDLLKPKTKEDNTHNDDTPEINHNKEKGLRTSNNTISIFDNDSFDTGIVDDTNENEAAEFPLYHDNDSEEEVVFEAGDGNSEKRDDAGNDSDLEDYVDWYQHHETKTSHYFEGRQKDKRLTCIDKIGDESSVQKHEDITKVIDSTIATILKKFHDRKVQNEILSNSTLKYKNSSQKDIPQPKCIHSYHSQAFSPVYVADSKEQEFILHERKRQVEDLKKQSNPNSLLFRRNLDSILYSSSSSSDSSSSVSDNDDSSLDEDSHLNKFGSHSNTEIHYNSVCNDLSKEEIHSHSTSGYSDSDSEDGGVDDIADCGDAEKDQTTSPPQVNVQNSADAVVELTSQLISAVGWNESTMNTIENHKDLTIRSSDYDGCTTVASSTTSGSSGSVLVSSYYTTNTEDTSCFLIEEDKELDAILSSSSSKVIQRAGITSKVIDNAVNRRFNSCRSYDSEIQGVEVTVNSYEWTSSGSSIFPSSSSSTSMDATSDITISTCTIIGPTVVFGPIRPPMECRQLNSKSTKQNQPLMRYLFEDDPLSCPTNENNLLAVSIFEHKVLPTYVCAITIHWSVLKLLNESHVRALTDSFFVEMKMDQEKHAILSTKIEKEGPQSKEFFIIPRTKNHFESIFQSTNDDEKIRFIRKRANGQPKEQRDYQKLIQNASLIFAENDEILCLRRSPQPTCEDEEASNDEIRDCPTERKICREQRKERITQRFGIRKKVPKDICRHGDAMASMNTRLEKLVENVRQHDKEEGIASEQVMTEKYNEHRSTEKQCQKKMHVLGEEENSDCHHEFEVILQQSSDEASKHLSDEARDDTQSPSTLTRKPFGLEANLKECLSIESTASATNKYLRQVGKLSAPFDPSYLRIRLNKWQKENDISAPVVNFSKLNYSDDKTNDLGAVLSHQSPKQFPVTPISSNQASFRVDEKHRVVCNTSHLPIVMASRSNFTAHHKESKEDRHILLQDDELRALMELTNDGDDTSALFPSVSLSDVDSDREDEDFTPDATFTDVEGGDDDDGLKSELDALESLQSDMRDEIEAAFDQYDEDLLNIARQTEKVQENFSTAANLLQSLRKSMKHGLQSTNDSKGLHGKEDIESTDEGTIQFFEWETEEELVFDDSVCTEDIEQKAYDSETEEVIKKVLEAVNESVTAPPTLQTLLEVDNEDFYDDMSTPKVSTVPVITATALGKLESSADIATRSSTVLHEISRNAKHNADWEQQAQSLVRNMTDGIYKADISGSNRILLSSRLLRPTLVESMPSQLDNCSSSDNDDENLCSKAVDQNTTGVIDASKNSTSQDDVIVVASSSFSSTTGETGVSSFDDEDKKSPQKKAKKYPRGQKRVTFSENVQEFLYVKDSQVFPYTTTTDTSLSPPSFIPSIGEMTSIINELVHELSLTFASVVDKTDDKQKRLATRKASGAKTMSRGGCV